MVVVLELSEGVHEPVRKANTACFVSAEEARADIALLLASRARVPRPCSVSPLGQPRYLEPCPDSQ